MTISTLINLHLFVAFLVGLIAGMLAYFWILSPWLRLRANRTQERLARKSEGVKGAAGDVVPLSRAPTGSVRLSTARS